MSWGPTDTVHLHKPLSGDTCSQSREEDMGGQVCDTTYRQGRWRNFWPEAVLKGSQMERKCKG